MIDKYKQAFQEEAREIVLELESALLELNERREDSELVGRVFHALHTIKGSEAMFGFDILAAFTHHIENAFDQVRDGRLIASPDLISLFLSAVDQIKAMLDKSSGRGKADDAKSAHILEKVANSRERSKALPQKSPHLQPKLRRQQSVQFGTGKSVSVRAQICCAPDRIRCCCSVNYGSWEPCRLRRILRPSLPLANSTRSAVTSRGTWF